jgi:hypothetical protein
VLPLVNPTSFESFVRSAPEQSERMFERLIIVRQYNFTALIMKQGEKEYILLKTNGSNSIQVTVKILATCPGMSTSSFTNKEPSKNGDVVLDCSSSTAEKLIQYLNNHNYEPKSYIPAPLPSSRMDLYLDSRDWKFLEPILNEPETLTQLLALAISTKTQPLVELISARIAAMFRGILI